MPPRAVCWTYAPLSQSLVRSPCSTMVCKEASSGLTLTQTSAVPHRNMIRWETEPGGGWSSKGTPDAQGQLGTPGANGEEGGRPFHQQRRGGIA